MPLRLPPIVVAQDRPTWLTAGMLRLVLLSLFAVAVGMIPLRLTPDDAWVVVAIGGGIAVAALAALLPATRRPGQSLGLPRGDLLAHSRGARSATMIEMLTAFALLTTYLASFVDWQQQRREPSVSEDLG